MSVPGPGGHRPFRACAAVPESSEGTVSNAGRLRRTPMASQGLSLVGLPVADGVGGYGSGFDARNVRRSDSGVFDRSPLTFVYPSLAPCYIHTLSAPEQHKSCFLAPGGVMLNQDERRNATYLSLRWSSRLRHSHVVQQLPISRSHAAGASSKADWKNFLLLIVRKKRPLDDNE